MRASRALPPRSRAREGSGGAAGRLALAAADGAWRCAWEAPSGETGETGARGEGARVVGLEARGRPAEEAVKEEEGGETCFAVVTLHLAAQPSGGGWATGAPAAALRLELLLPPAGLGADGSTADGATRLRELWTKDIPEALFPSVSLSI